MEDGIAKREIRLRQLLQQEEDDRAAVRQSIRELNDQNELLELGTEHEAYVRALQAERLDQDHQPLLAALRQRERQVEDMLNCLRQAGSCQRRL